MDRWQYISKFSSELLVAALVLIIAGANFALHFTGKNYRDTSLAMQLLANNPEWNPKVFAQNNAIVTSVQHNSIFATQAYAETILASDQAAIANPDGSTDQTTPPDDELNYIQDDGIHQPKLDSVQGLLDSSVKIVKVKRTDTVYTLAAEYGISVKTIMTVNKLDKPVIQEGWVLVLPPHDDELVIKYTDDNVTLPDLAKKYQAKEEDIMAANGMANAEDLPPIGKFLIIPHGQMPQPPKPKPQPKPTTPSKGKGGTGSLPKYSGDTHTFPRGYCTYYVASLMEITFGGNAGTWLAHARADGYDVSKNAAAGTAVVTNESPVGHVAYVTHVGADTITVTEMNYIGFNRISSRVIPKDSPHIKGYIYPKYSK